MKESSPGYSAASVYFGEASDLRCRFGQYRNPGPSQQTNQRLNDLLGRALVNCGRCRVSVVEVQWFEGKFCEVEPDLRLKAARVLVESAAIVLARSDGKRIVLNLDEAFDRALGGELTAARTLAPAGRRGPRRRCALRSGRPCR